MKNYTYYIIGASVLALAIGIIVAVDRPQAAEQKSPTQIEIEYEEGKIAERSILWQQHSASGTVLQLQLQAVMDEMRRLEGLNATSRQKIQLLKGGGSSSASPQPLSFVPHAYAESPLPVNVPAPIVAPVFVKEEKPNVTGQEDYKVQRLREMRDLMIGTVLEKHTVKLLSMLLQEDGTLTAERRHDCKGGTCFSVGIQGHHICHRGTPLVAQDHGKPFKKFCTWADTDGDGKYETSPMAQFEKEYPAFATDWRVQFAEYQKRMTGYINDGYSVNACIQAWNSREAGRIAKVDSHAAFVRAALE